MPLAKFLIKIGPRLAKYGRKKANAIIKWVRRNWPTVKRWLERGMSLAAIIEMILRALGF